jgi:hypothetical protein
MGAGAESLVVETFKEPRIKTAMTEIKINPATDATITIKIFLELKEFIGIEII